MDYKLIWTDHDLGGTVGYIAKEDPVTAKQVGMDIL